MKRGHSSPAKIVGVIPARWGSTRLPGKSLVMIAGKPLIQRVVERARKARKLDLLIVATDDRRIAEVVEGLGVRVAMTRPDHPSGTDRVAEAVRGTGAQIVVNIQGDEPLIDPKLIDGLADVMAGGKWDMATAAARIREPRDFKEPSVVKVVFDTSGRALYFSRYAIPFVRDGEAEPAKGLHWRHIGIYAYRIGFLRRLVREPVCELERAEKLEQLRALHIGGRIAVVRTAKANPGVDTPEDVKRVEAELARHAG